ncbi:hypothetical protein D1007_04811 [Hordeum vulgare]|nr:hypothetical protein D1007_04811 [Hordeum vulgare]
MTRVEVPKVGSSTGTMPTMMDMLLGRVGGKECSGGRLGLASCRWQKLCPNMELEACACCGPGCLVVASVSCRAKALCFDTGDDDPCGRHSPLALVVVGVLSVPWFHVKTYVLPGLGNGDAWCRPPF